MKRTAYNWQYGDCLYRIRAEERTKRCVSFYSVYAEFKQWPRAWWFHRILHEQKSGGRRNSKKYNKNLES